MNRLEFDPDELEFQREIRAVLGTDRGNAGACPNPRLLTAARSGIPFEGFEAVQRHVALCPICQQLSLDLAAYAFPRASEAEDRRIRSRWQTAATGSAQSWYRGWRPLSLAAAVVLLVVTAVMIRSLNRSVAPTRQAAQPPVSAASPPAVPASGSLTLSKAAIKIPAFAVLTFRGDANSANSYLADLAAALEPYRQDNFAKAAQTLAALSRRYPRAAEPAYYLGISQLFLAQNQAAVESLQTARRYAADTLREDVSWYLIVAFDRSGKTPEALREAEALCGRGGEYRDRSCAAAAELRPR